MFTNRRTLVASLAVFAATGSLAAVNLPGEKERWRTAEAGGFTIYSNASEGEIVRLEANLQHMRDALGSIFQINTRSPRPIRVFLFDDTKSFAPFRDSLMGRKAKMVAGAFLHGRDAEYILLDAQHHEASENIAYHELTHLFIESTTPDVPLWFNEGLAVFLSTFEVVGTKVKIGRPDLANIQLLREHGRMPLGRLLSVTPDAKEYTEEGHAGVFYAESWAFVHYLLMGAPQRKGQLTAYLAAVKQGHSPEEAFRSAFQCDFATLENELGSYLQREGLQYRIVDLSALPAAATPKPIPVPRDEILFELGDLLSQCNACDLADARTFLDEALRVNPSNGQATLLLEQLSRGPTPDLALEPQPPRPGEPSRIRVREPQPDPTLEDLIAAEGIVGELTGTPTPPDEQFRARLARARELFQAVLARNPNSTRACNGLARTYRFQIEDTDAAIATFERSLTINPGQAGVLAEMIDLCVRRGRRPKADEIMDRYVKTNPNPEVRRQCEDILALGDANEGARLVREGRAEDGLALIERAIAGTSNPTIQDQLRDSLAMLKADLDRHRQVDLFNQAAAKAREGDLVGAYKIVDALLLTATDHEVIERAKSLREKLRPFLINPEKKP